MKHRSLALAVSAVVLGAVALTGCGSGTTGADDGTLEFWQNQFSEEDNAWYKKQVEAFNAAHDDVQIKLTVVPGDAWEQKLKAAQAAGNAPDMYTMNYSAVPMKARNGELAPIGDLLDQAAWDDLEPRFLEAVTVDGEQYAYPLLYEPSALLLYRTDYFTAAGLDPAAPPTTWDELIETGLALKAADPNVVPFQLAQNAVELSWTTWSSQYGTAGHLPISDDWSTSEASDPAYEPLFQFYQDLYAQGVIAPQPLSPYGDAAPLGEGTLAMMANGSWGISLLINQYPDVIENLGVAAMPTIDGDPDRTSATLGGWTIGVDAKSDQTEEAAAAVSWLLAEDTAVPMDYFISTKFSKLSPRISVAAELAADPGKSVNPFYDILVESTGSAILEPTYDWQVSLAMGTALEKAMLGGNIAEAQAEADATITKVIADLDLAAQKNG
ncbi:MAG: extracellular solute-binding protein [Rhodoglobus sp.]|nr:extracellular solute-binding protein [Rhodoglobus sp.]